MFLYTATEALMLSRSRCADAVSETVKVLSVYKQPVPWPQEPFHFPVRVSSANHEAQSWTVLLSVGQLFFPSLPWLAQLKVCWSVSPTKPLWVLLLKALLFLSIKGTKPHKQSVFPSLAPSLQAHTSLAPYSPIFLCAPRELCGGYESSGGTIKLYNTYHCEMSRDIKVILLVDLRCNLKPRLLTGTSFPRRMDVCNDWVFKLCSHKEKKLVPMRPLCNSITQGSLVHGSNHASDLIRDCAWWVTCCSLLERSEYKGVLDKYKIKQAPCLYRPYCLA